MNGVVSSRNGSWTRAWIAGAFVPFAIGTPLSLVVDAWRGIRSEQGLDFADWSPGILPFIALTATVAAIVALLFVLLVRVAERSGPRTLPVWLLLGLAAATPILLLFAGLVATYPFDRATITVWSYGIPAFYLYLASIAGVLAAWRVRRGAWHG